MNAQTALSDLLTGHSIKWQPTPTVFTTTKGKQKWCICGVPGPVFWKHYRSDDGQLRGVLRLSGAWLRRVTRSQWEILYPVKPREVHLLAPALGVEPSTLDLPSPELETSDSPF